jgi:hypothetical protein
MLLCTYMYIYMYTYVYEELYIHICINMNTNWYKHKYYRKFVYACIQILICAWSICMGADRNDSLQGESLQSNRTWN